MHLVEALKDRKASEFSEFVQVVWGFSELSRRAVEAGEDPGPFLDVVLSASKDAADASTRHTDVRRSQRGSAELRLQRMTRGEHVPVPA